MRFLSLSLFLFSVIIELFGVIAALERVIGEKLGGNEGEGLDQVKIDPTCLSFDFNLFFLLRSMSKIYRVLTLFIFFFRLISTSLRRNIYVEIF